LEARNKALTTLRKLDEIMMASLGFEDVAQKVTDAIAYELKFNIGVLALVDEQRGVLRRVAISRTYSTEKGKRLQSSPFEKTEIRLVETRNLGIRAILEKKVYVTSNLYDVLVPAESEETARKIQEIGNIKSSLVYPVSSKGKVIGVMIFSLDKHSKELSIYEMEMMKKLIDVVGIALDNAQVYQQLRDITKQLAQANEKLKQLDKLKDDFVSIASHELRTPMTAIRSYAWMALHRSDIPLSQRLERYLYRTLISTERLINLVNDMLNVSRIESGKIEIDPKPFDIVMLVKEVCEEVKAKADEKKLKLELLGHKVPQVFADPDKVHQVLLNLVGNALKFTYPGGIISIDFFTDGQVVEVSVKDNGAGISQEDLSQLFHKFARLDNSYISLSTSGGTGLGLYISKSLIELMHGRIWVKSKGMDQGSTFTFSLPVVSQEILQHANAFKIESKGEVKSLESVAI